MHSRIAHGSILLIALLGLTHCGSDREEADETASAELALDIIDPVPDPVEVTVERVEAPYIFGVHSIEPHEGEKAAVNLITRPDGSRKGSWTVFTHYTNRGGGIDFNRLKRMIDDGFSPILRFDYDHGQTLPPGPDDSCDPRWDDDVVDAMAQLAQFCDGACSTTFVIGNEMNASFENGDSGSGISVARYASCFRAIRSEMKGRGVPGTLLVGAISPLNADTSASCAGSEDYDDAYKKYLHCLIQATKDDADGFALHAYGGRGGNADPRSDERRDGFQNYKLQLEIVDKAGGDGKPIYITEFNNAGSLVADAGEHYAEQPYQSGFIQKAYQDVAAYSGENGCRIKALVWFAYENPAYAGLNLTNWDEDAALYRCDGKPCNLRQAFDDFRNTALYQEYATSCFSGTRAPGGNPVLEGGAFGAQVGENAARLIELLNRGGSMSYSIESQASWLTIDAPVAGDLAPSESVAVAVRAACGAAPSLSTGSIKIRYRDRYGAHERSLPVSLECRIASPPEPPGPPPGGSHGDPHLRTLDGLFYDFQGAGEFVLLEGGSDFALQVREQPLGASDAIAVNSALAMRIGASRLAFYAGASPALWVDGRPTEVAGRLELPGGPTIYRAGERYVITSASGDYVEVHARGSHLDLRVSPAPARAGLLGGLLGNGNGDPADDFTTRAGGVVLSPPLSRDALYHTFGDSFRISPAESLFDYAPGESTETFTIADFPRETATVSSLPAAVRDSARATCASAGVTDPFLLDACILDVGVSGNPIFASSATGATPPAVGMQALYVNDFEAPIGPEWSASKASTTPIGGRRFLGDFNNETVTLSLSGLAPHAKVRVSFDLYVIRSWDGNEGDVFTLSAVGSTSSFPMTFANTGAQQSYPDLFGAGAHPSRTGAVESNSLGYNHYGDAVYRLSYELVHGAPDLAIRFSGSGLQHIGDESWGLDNVEVVAL